jgi:hypothetical protein
LRIKQPFGLDGAQAPPELRFQRVLADQRQRVGGDMRRFAGDDFEIGQFVGWGEFIRSQHDRQMAEARILRQHRQERVDHAQRETFRDDDAVDVAIGEVIGGGFDAEGPDHARTLAERDRERREAAAAADQEHGRMQRRITLCQLGGAWRLGGKAAQNRCIQGADPQRRAQSRDQAIVVAAAQRQRQSILGKLALSLDRNQGKVGLACSNLLRQCRKARVVDASHVGDDGSRLDIRCRAHRVAPVGVNDRKQSRLVERGCKRRPAVVSDDEDRPLLGHQTNPGRER